jgi:glycosyl transferase family 87
VICLVQMYEQMRHSHGNDLTVYLFNAWALAHGEDPYATAVAHNSPRYPLTLAALLIPLTWVPAWAAQTIWFVASIAALIASLWILDELWPGATVSPGQAPRLPFVIRLAAVVLALALPLRSNLVLGQVNLMVLLVCCLFVRAHLAGRWLGASLWLGLASALKVTPLVFLVGLLGERRYRTLLATGGCVVLWAVVLPRIVSDRAWRLYREAWAPFITQSLQEPVRFGQSSRFTFAGALVYAWPALARVPGLRYWAAIAALAPLVWLQSRVGRDGRVPLVAFALYLLTMPLISPLSEQHHLVILVAPLWCWLLLASDESAARRFDVVGGALFLSLHWLAVRRFYVLDFLALAVLYVALLLRGARLGSEASHPHVAPAS